ncbi:ubiquitin-like protein ATG12 [Trichechus manatus latirostris]|uniref:Ubiquitin-like protein ATG12 n=1 Tax=Trichechus manatus latirostris TaxID=127582 RepID=A0A2Y9RS07_TRIMA|nr:ubiquitin-like protein ATG12 [Trichechus manatus latirostris]
MAEEPESVLQLPPSTAVGSKGLTEVFPETVTPEPPSSAAVSLGTEDTKEKLDILLKTVVYLCESVLCPFSRLGSWNSL